LVAGPVVACGEVVYALGCDESRVDSDDATPNDGLFEPAMRVKAISAVFPALPPRLVVDLVDGAEGDGPALFTRKSSINSELGHSAEASSIDSLDHRILRVVWSLPAFNGSGDLPGQVARPPC
jgi:hypothetical protein